MKNIRFVIPAVIVLALGGIGYQLFIDWKTDIKLIREARARMEQADPAALLAACDALIANRTNLVDRWGARFKASDTIRLESSDHGTPVPWQEGIPSLIQNMDPLWIEISEETVHIHLNASLRMGFWADAEGAPPSAGPHGTEVTALTNRLMMYVD